MSRRLNGVKSISKGLGILVFLGISAQWAPTLTSLLVTVVVLRYACYAWSTIAESPRANSPSCSQSPLSPSA
jgi:hypothetical protein